MTIARAGTALSAAGLFILFAGALWALPGVGGFGPSGVGVAAAWATLAALLCGLAMRGSARNAWLAGIAAAAALRLLVLFALAGNGPMITGNDYAAYLALGRSLAGGDGLIAVTDHYGPVRGMYPPLYPVLLAAAGAPFGPGMGTVLAVNFAIDLGAAALIARLGGRMGHERAGLAAALLYLVWPSLVVVTPLAQKEGLIVLLVLAVAAAFQALAQSGPSWRNAAWLGLASALIALTQPALAAFPVFLALTLLPRAGARALLIFAARALPLFLLVMLPWWARNFMLFGGFVPLTTSGGASMTVAATGAHATLGPDLLALSEPARSALLADQARAAIAADPLAFLVRRMLGMAAALTLNDYNLLRLAGFVPPVRWGYLLAPAAQLSHAAALGLAALALARGKAGHFGAALIVAAGLQLGLVNLWFEFGQRHREFLTPFLLLLAAMALVSCPAAHAAASRASADRR